MISKNSFKRLLGDIPLTAEAYWLLRQRGKSLNKSFSFERLERELPGWCLQADSAKKDGSTNFKTVEGRKVLIFATLRYWIEHAVLLSLAMAGQGMDVIFMYLPYANWRKRISKFDLRRQNAYARKVLSQIEGQFQSISLLDVPGSKPNQQRLPEPLLEAIAEVSLRDTQYTMQIEEIDREDEDSPSYCLYKLRQERNQYAALAFLAYINSIDPSRTPDTIITPNGSILEMGAIYQTARYLEIPIVTYEFGEQRERIWLAQNDEVMFQNTENMWDALKKRPFSEDQKARIRDLYSSRRDASLWKNFSRLWQDSPGQGGEQVYADLKLDSRPVVLLAANVIGDSLTLGRQVFTKNMTEWLQRTLQYFVHRTDKQLIVRIHPGERYTRGPSVADVIRKGQPSLPEHIHVIEAGSTINTYDLLEISDLGLVYTTTVGMEMAMAGIPVIVAGKTHYRSKGFTFDPISWEEYFSLLDKIITNPLEYQLSKGLVDKAWQYAYCFFFEYPCSFPWHLLFFWEELESWSIERFLSSDGQQEFGHVFKYLVGEPRSWNESLQVPSTPTSESFMPVEQEF